MTRNTLRRSLRNILIGMGSILDLCPAPRKELQFPPIKTDEEAIADAWQKVGDDLSVAMNKEIDDA